MDISSFLIRWGRRESFNPAKTTSRTCSTAFLLVVPEFPPIRPTYIGLNAEAQTKNPAILGFMATDKKRATTRDGRSAEVEMREIEAEISAIVTAGKPVPARLK